MSPNLEQRIKEYAARLGQRGIRSVTPFYKEGRFCISVKVTRPKLESLRSSFEDASTRDLCVKELLKCKSASRAESTQS